LANGKPGRLSTWRGEHARPGSVDEVSSDLVTLLLAANAEKSGSYRHATVKCRASLLVSPLVPECTPARSCATQRHSQSTLDTSPSSCEIQLKTKHFRRKMASQELRHFVDAVFATQPWRLHLGRQQAHGAC